MSQSNQNEVIETNQPAAEPEAAAISEPSKTPSRGWLAWVIVSILLVLIAAAGWFGYRHLVPMHQHHQQLLADLQAAQQTDQAQIAALTEQLSSQATQIEQRVAEALSEQQQTLNRQLQQQREQLSDYQLVVQSVQAELANLDMSQESNWRLFEARELANRAATKLWIEHNPHAALAFLQLAESHLKALNNPAHMNVRQALANNIAQLQQLPDTQIETVSLKLGTMRDQISRSSWYQQLAMTAEDGGTTNENDWWSHLKRSSNTLLQQFIRVQRRDTPIEPMIADAYFDVVQQRVLLQLQVAQNAAMQGMQLVYEGAIDEAIAQLQILEGQLTDTGISSLISELDALKTVELRPEYPTELSVLPLLERLVQQQSQGG